MEKYKLIRQTNVAITRTKDVNTSYKINKPHKTGNLNEHAKIFCDVEAAKRILYLLTQIVRLNKECLTNIKMFLFSGFLNSFSVPYNRT